MKAASPFEWKTGQPSVMRNSEKIVAPAVYPQLAYYHRKKAGLTGSRDKPNRQWRARASV